MLKKTLFVYFVFFSFCLLQGEESFKQTVDEWENIYGKEIALFVNNTNRSFKKPNGSKKAPFQRIEDAFTYLNGLKKRDVKVTIYVTGNFISKNVYIITMPTKIVSFDFYKDEIAEKEIPSCISFEKNAGFVVTSSQLFIEKCIISRREFIDEPRSVPILYSSNSFINLKNVTLTAKEGGTVFLFIESNVNMDTVIINSKQNGYCNIIETIKSNLKIENAHLNCGGRFVVSIDSKESSLGMKNVFCNIQAHLSAIALKVSSGDVSIQNSFFGLEGIYVQKDEAITYNAKANLSMNDIELKGFTLESKLKVD